MPVFTVAENIVMGTEPTRFSFSWRTLGWLGGVAALLFFLGGLFAYENLSQWLLAALAGGIATAALYGLLILLGFLSRRLAFRLYFVLVAAASVAVLLIRGFVLDASPQIPLLVFGGLLFAGASYPAMRVLATTLDRYVAGRLSLIHI